jgi:CRISPR/Cas system-associated protein Cas10 (large subunit of type III CRISPR-Cas system)
MAVNEKICSFCGEVVANSNQKRELILKKEIVRLSEKIDELLRLGGYQQAVTVLDSKRSEYVKELNEINEKNA